VTKKIEAFRRKREMRNDATIRSDADKAEEEIVEAEERIQARVRIVGFWSN